MSLGIWLMAVNAIKNSVAAVWRTLNARASEEAIDFKDPVGGAIKDAELLIAFAAQSFRRIKPEKVARLTQTAAVISAARDAGQIVTHEQRSAFWTAYDELAVDMAPLSAHSIRSSMNVNAKRIPASLLTPTAIIAAFAVLVFFLCMLVQGFWAAGKELTDRAEKLDLQKREIQQKMARNDSALSRTRSRQDDIQSQICKISKDPCDDEPPKPTILKRNEAERLVELNAEAKWVRSEMLAFSLQENELNAEFGKLNELGRPLNDLLKEWHKRARKLCSNDYLFWLCPLGIHLESEQSITDLKTKIQALEKELRAPLAIPDDAYSSGNYTILRLKAERERRARENNIQSLKIQLGKAENDKFGSVLLEVKIIVSNISTYLIAMLMGLLGALTFILRTMSHQLREHTYVPTSVSISIIRICLGAIAGVFGSMLAPGAEAGLKSVPPLFIPFVFGYGIEILFSLLDKTVHSFTHPESGAGNGQSRR